MQHELKFYILDPRDPWNETENTGAELSQRVCRKLIQFSNMTYRTGNIGNSTYNKRWNRNYRHTEIGLEILQICSRPVNLDMRILECKLQYLRPF
jgi:hypothetical protein